MLPSEFPSFPFLLDCSFGTWDEVFGAAMPGVLDRISHG